MGIIHVLDMSVANLIAAGEVVERPASAVKELVENAMDAGAHTITVEIKRGGVSFLRVTDDGCGMSDADAVSCLQRHATSKIKDADDLSRILTLGFRGEALAAISSVTNLRILTRLRGAESGTLVHCEYGKVTEIAEGGYPEGTTVICEGLFARVPARLQFLKSDQSEGMAVAALMEKMAVSHPEIAFRFIADEQSKFHTTGDGNLKNAVYAVYGREFASKMTEVSASSGGITVSGFISTPEYVRGNRHMELFFINSRLVSNKTMVAALENAYTSYIPVGKFPACVMFLKIHASAVDVNVHPSKAEVKFHNEKVIFDAVYYSVRGALEARIVRPALDVIQKTKTMTEEKWNAVSGFADLKREKPEQLSVADVLPEKKPEPIPVSQPIPKPAGSLIFTPKREAPPETFAEKPLHAPSTFDYAAGMTARVASPTTIPKKETPKNFYDDTDAKLKTVPEREIPPYRIVGEVFDSYIILEVGQKMLLVDKHAAHERINFERLKAGMQLRAPAVQTLLVPEQIVLSGEEADAARNFETEIASVGFRFSVEGHTMTVTAVPPDTDMAMAKNLLETLVSAATENGAALEAEKRSIFERALYQASCKSAIKAGRHYDDVHIKWICDNLLRYDCIKYCPHGRPVAFEMTKSELDHRFGRT